MLALGLIDNDTEALGDIEGLIEGLILAEGETEPAATGVYVA